MQISTIQTNMLSGEIDPLLAGRVDVAEYNNGLKKARNVFLLPQGGATRRQGSTYIDQLPVTTGSRCIPFVFSNTQTYKLVFTNTVIDVYNGTSKVATVTGTPYLAADLAEIKFTQSFDTMLLFHENYPIQQLTRASHTSWTLAAFAVTVPKHQFTGVSANPAGTATPTTTGGTTKLTLSSAVALTSWVGQYIRGNGGVGRIVKRTSSTNITLSMIVPFYDTNAIASGSWEYDSGYENAWSASRGYPRCGTFHQERLFVGGSRDLPMNIWASHVDDFGNFDLGQNNDAEGIAVSIEADTVAAINQLHSGSHLQIFTSSAEFFVPTSSNAAITPNNITVLRSTQFGSHSTTPVFSVDGETIFINRSGANVRSHSFDDLRKSYVSPSLTVAATHILNAPVDMAFRKSTSADTADYLFIVNADGTVSMLNKIAGQTISGWSKLEFQGLVKSIAVELDTIFFVIERVINSATVHYLEEFDVSRVLDSSVLYTSGLPTSTFTGLGHLEGELVEVIADGNRLTPVTVSSGSVTIERDGVTSVEIGMRFKASGDDYTIQTLPVEIPLQSGSMVGKKKRILEATLIVDSTKSLKVNGNRVSFRKLGSGLLDADTPSFTGQKVVEGLLGYSDEATLTIGDDVAQPATINAIAYKVSV